MEEKYMRRAIELAQKGEGWCHPNPLVGAVIVKNGKIIGEGYHAKYGELHAERNALAACSESAEGAEIYVTLEPCCHYGKTPPCTEAIIENGIKKVIVGSSDPNPKVAGGGVKALREAGIEVVEGFLRDECDSLNDIFFHYISSDTPYVIGKYAMTADGKIATVTGDSKWISSEASRADVQFLRHRCMGIMAGIGTVIADDPMLNCRIENGRSPIRIITDSSLKISTESRIIKTAGEYETIIATAFEGIAEGEISPESLDGVDLPEAEKIKEIIGKGAKIVNFPKNKKVDLLKLMKNLKERGIDSILCEGGGELNASMLKEGLIREMQVYIAPKIFGSDGRSPVGRLNVMKPVDGVDMKLKSLEEIGDDVKITYKVE